MRAAARAAPRQPYYQSERSDIYTESYKAGSKGAGLPLLLLPQPAPRRQCAPHASDGKVIYRRHLPGADRRGNRRKRNKTRAPAYRLMVPTRGHRLHRTAIWAIYAENLAARLRRLLPAPGRRRVCLSAGRRGGRCPDGRHRGRARGRPAIHHAAPALAVPVSWA